jgi:sugar lactone lactonase YvrE
MRFELAIDAKAVLAETPIWDHRIRRLYWTDLFNGTVHRYDPVTGKSKRAETRSVIGSAVPCETEGKLLVAVDEGMMLLDFATGKLEPIAQPEKNTGQFRYNDTRCDSVGRIYTSTVSKRLTEPDFDPDRMAGKFYQIDTDGQVTVLEDKLVQYNTPFFDSGNKYLYVVDTQQKRLLRYPYSIAKGARGPAEAVIQFEDMPDGVSVDVDDRIYVCHWGDKKRISVWSLKDYSFIEFIPFPVKHICCGGFAGEDMKDFYVATSLFWIPEGDGDLQAGAGGLFKARSPIPGRREFFYKDQR